MSRAARLFDLIEILRRHRFPVPGARLADELGVSLRTLYRDIATLQGQGADIEGEPGLGYVLRPGFMLPPLMFTEDEIEALVLGSRWVSARTDHALSRAAQGALAKIAAVLPPDLRGALDADALMVGKSADALMGAEAPGDAVDLSLLRRAIRAERKVMLSYRDVSGAASERTVWPIALGYFEQTRMLAAWCELRQAFRHFRADRIVVATALAERYPRRRRALMEEWRAADARQKAARAADAFCQRGEG